MPAEEILYTVLLRDGAFEIRDYPSRVVAEVTVNGNDSGAIAAGFHLLERYIFGQNRRRTRTVLVEPTQRAVRKNQQLAITAPVLRMKTVRTCVIRFNFPEAYTLDTVPEPSDARINLVELRPLRIAVVRFSGFATDRRMASEISRLAQFVVACDLRQLSAAWLATYNSFWTPWFLRRNEILLTVDADERYLGTKRVLEMVEQAGR